MNTLPRAFGRSLPLVPLLALAACGSDSPSAPPRPEPPDPPELPDPIAIPAQGTDATLDLATWNVLNFGVSNQGPTNDLLQFARVRDVIKGTDADLWGMQEVIGRGSFDSLIAALPGYAGLLANDPTVVGGTNSYYDAEIKVGLIYKTAIFEPVAARIILADLNHEFAGRPPLEVTGRLTFGGATHDAVVIVLHAKASADTASWRRRAAAGNGLKEHLDENWSDALVFVPGDWNDDVDESITSGRDTPYRQFVSDTAAWAFPTAELSAAGETSIIGYDDIIDHILASDEVMAWYQTGSTVVHRVDEHIPNYRETTTDHLPVIIRLRPDGG